MMRQVNHSTVFIGTAPSIHQTAMGRTNVAPHHRRQRLVYRVALGGAVFFLSLVALLVYFAPTQTEHERRNMAAVVRDKQIRYHEEDTVGAPRGDVVVKSHRHEGLRKFFPGEGAVNNKSSLVFNNTGGDATESQRQPPHERHGVKIPVADDSTPQVSRQLLIIGPEKCSMWTDPMKVTRAGDTVVRMLAEKRLQDITSKSKAAQVISSPIFEIQPILPHNPKRFFPADSLVVTPKDYIDISLLKDSMRVVAASAPSLAGSSIDTRLVCDVDEAHSSSSLSWGFDWGRQGSGSVKIGFMYHAEGSGSEHVQATATFPPTMDVAFYGLASRGAGVELNPNDEVPLKNLDVNHYKLDAHANLYGSVPLVYAVDKKHAKKLTIGLLWLNGSPLKVRTESSNEKQSITFSSEAGAAMLYVLPGPTPADVLRQYYFLTGFPMLPPLFSIGYHQCRWSYKDQHDVIDVNDKFTKFKIPMDAMWLDIDHTDDRRYFTWNSNLFPDSKAMIAHLVEHKRKLVTISDPHIKVDPNYFVYRAAHEKKFFITTGKGSTEEFNGHCWPGKSAWIDFSNPKAREWYATLFDPESYRGSTLDVFTWNDMNEPSVFSGPELTMPMDAGQYGGYEHRELHNLYGFYHSMATFAGHLYRSHSELRPFSLTRSFFAGSQRYAAVWTGDNQAQWSHLHNSVAMLLMHSMSGIPFIGADVGGFFDNPSEELHVRWYQLGCLYPFFRGHSHEETRRREPWLQRDAVRDNIADAIRFRYTLLPYLYLCFYDAHTFGTSVWLSKMFLYPHDPKSYINADKDESFFVGRHLLAAPALHEGQSTVELAIPQGDSFVDFWTGEGHVGGSSVSLAVPSTLLRSPKGRVVPLLQRAGTVIPIAAPSSSDTILSSQSITEVSLVVALNEQCAAVGRLYQDDGQSTDFAKKGAFCVMHITAHRMKSFNGGADVIAMKGTVLGDSNEKQCLVMREEKIFKPNTVGSNALRFAEIAHVQLMTELCPSFQGLSSIEVDVTSAVNGEEHQSNSDLQKLRQSWKVKKRVDGVWDASGPAIRNAEWSIILKP